MADYTEEGVPPVPRTDDAEQNAWYFTCASNILRYEMMRSLCCTELHATSTYCRASLTLNSIIHINDSMVQSYMDRDWFGNVSNLDVVEPNEEFDIHLH